MSELTNADVEVDPREAVLSAIAKLDAKARTGELTASEASALASLARTAATLARPAEDPAASLLEVERRARLMAGLPPATPEEWAWAERTFTAEAVEEFRRWAARPRGAAYWAAESPDAVDDGVAGSVA